MSVEQVTEHHKGSKAVHLSFYLPTGSYATVVVRQFLILAAELR